MRRRPLIALSAAAVVALLLLGSALFTVPQTEQVLITQFGQPIRVITKPGLHVKLPLLQDVIPFDRRLLLYELPAVEATLGDQRRLRVDGFVMFRITNPLLYYQSVGPTEAGILARLNAVASSSLLRVLGREHLLNVLSSDRTRIMGMIRDQVNQEMTSFGVSVIDVRIRRADLPAENTKAVLSRMQTERERVASEARAEGAEAATKIRADAERERTVLLANARAQADALRGQGEAVAIATYAQAFDQDPHFFAIWRTLEAYRQAFASGHSRLVLTPGTEFLHFLNHEPEPAAAPPAAAKPAP
jgi:membrane protease subunit HflC